MTTTIAAFLNPLLMIAMPVLLGIWLATRLKAEWRLFGLGMVAFVGSQLLHIPFNAWVLSPLIRTWGLEPTPASAQLALVGALLGLSAGVFEETARYLVYRRWLCENRRWRDGLMLGAGHGGMEAMLLGLLSLYSFLQLSALRGTDLARALRPEQVESVRSALQMYWSLPYYQHLIPSLERAAAICLHLGLSVLVLQTFTRHNRLWFVLAIAWHAVVDAVAVFGISTWGVYVTEGLVVIAGLLSVGMALALRRQEHQTPLPESPLPPRQPTLPHIAPAPEELDRNQLDKSRYSDGS